MTESAVTDLAEKRASLEDPSVPISSARIIDIFGLGGASASGVNVTIENALGVSAIWAAVNFLSGTMAGLPLNLYDRTGDGRNKSKSRLASMLHYNINEQTSSFAWRKQMFERVLTSGRSYTLIVRGDREPIRYLWPLENSLVKPRRDSMGRKTYDVGTGSDAKTYAASEIIDMSFMMCEDGVNHRGPITTNKNTIGMGIAATAYGSRFFNNGGVPPFVLMGNFQSASALNRASADLQEAVKAATKDSRLALTLPDNHKLEKLGVDPEKSQLVDLQKFLIEEYARIYQLPPIFLQDLSHGTFSNTEQQDLHLVKHTIKRWVEQLEQELNLKLFGWQEHEQYVELNMDGLLRGDYKTRMEGNAKAIQTAQLTPNEGRRMDNRPDLPGGDQLMIQGATVPLGSQPVLSVPLGDPNDEA